MKKTISFIVVLLAFTTLSFGQSLLDESFDSVDVALPAQLFSINQDQYNHHFTYNLPNNGILKIDFLRLSDWGNHNELAAITKTAAQQVQSLKDSFYIGNTTKLLALNIPIDQQVISIDYKEDQSKKNQMAFKDGKYYQLKTSADTIRVVRNVGVREKPNADSGLIQIQYTYILKDINDIQNLVDHPEVINNIGTLTDSVIEQQRKKWSHQDRFSHTLTLNYNPEAKKPLTLNTLLGRTQRFSIFIGFGAIVYNSSVSPYTEVTYAYTFPTRGPFQGFVGININAFGIISTTPSRTTATAFYRNYNAEFGVFKKGSLFMAKKTSIVLGIMDVKDEKPLFNFGFNFGLNSYSSVGFLMSSNFRGGDKTRNVYGVNLKFNL